MWKFPVSLFVFSLEVEALPWLAPLSCREGFLAVGCFVFVRTAWQPVLSPCPQALPAMAGIGESSSACPLFCFPSTPFPVSSQG